MDQDTCLCGRRDTRQRAIQAVTIIAASVRKTLFDSRSVKSFIARPMNCFSEYSFASIFF